MNNQINVKEFLDIVGKYIGVKNDKIAVEFILKILGSIGNLFKLIKVNNENHGTLEGYVCDINDETREDGEYVVNFCVKSIHCDKEGSLYFTPLNMTMYGSMARREIKHIEEFKWYLVKYKLRYSVKNKTHKGIVVHIRCTEPIYQVVDVGKDTDNQYKIK